MSSSARSSATCVTALLLVVSLAGAKQASGQGGDASPIVSDRPDFTESPVVVPPGFVQLETGMTHQREDGSGILSVGEALLRIPLSHRLEARLGLPTLVVNGSNRITDSSIGAKVELPAGPGDFEFGLIGTVSLPTGQSPLSSEVVIPSLILAAGGPLSQSIGLGAQIAAALPERADSRVLASGATIVLSTPLGDRTGAFAELAAESVEFENVQILSHVGLTYSLDPHRQLDVHVGSALTDDAPDLFIGVGFVYRR